MAELAAASRVPRRCLGIRAKILRTGTGYESGLGCSEQSWRSGVCEGQRRRSKAGLQPTTLSSSSLPQPAGCPPAFLSEALEPKTWVRALLCPLRAGQGVLWGQTYLCRRQCLSWDITPPPQDREQVDQELHSPHHLVTSSSQGPAPSAASLLS